MAGALRPLAFFGFVDHRKSDRTQGRRRVDPNRRRSQRPRPCDPCAADEFRARPRSSNSATIGAKLTTCPNKGLVRGQAARTRPEGRAGQQRRWRTTPQREDRGSPASAGGSRTPPERRGPGSVCDSRLRACRCRLHESRPPDWPSLTVNDALGEIGAGLRLARDGLRPETAR